MIRVLFLKTCYPYIYLFILFDLNYEIPKSAAEFPTITRTSLNNYLYIHE